MHCGLVQVNPRQTEEELNQFYKKDYHTQSISSNKPKKKYIQKRVVLAKQRISFLTSRIKVHGKTILDIGCSYGEFLKRISPLAREAKGIEPGYEFSLYGKKMMGVDIFNGTLKEYINVYPKKRYDIVALFTVLEHIHSPQEFLLDVWSIVNENGYVFLEVPELNSFLNRVRNKKSLNSYFSPFHLQYYTINTIRRSLIMAGFRPIEVNMDRKKYARDIAKKVPTLKNYNQINDPPKENYLTILVKCILWRIKDKLVDILF
ncbi:class I SAM-dependent methyltransferase, partial [bacterium]|nr:class I SAM-dependent methyltransferase [bacterium]